MEGRKDLWFIFADHQVECIDLWRIKMLRTDSLQQNLQNPRPMKICVYTVTSYIHNIYFVILLVTDQPDTEETSLIATALRTVAMPTDPYKYLKQYWIIVTTGAFLLVILVGEVTLLKVVFMIFFLLFIFAYEVRC